MRKQKKRSWKRLLSNARIIECNVFRRTLFSSSSPFYFPFGLGRPSASQDATQFTLMLLHAQRWRRTAHWGSLVRYMVDLDFRILERAIYGKQTLGLVGIF